MFEHSVRVPRLYKTAANIAKKVRDEGASVKGLVFEKKHPNIKALYALVVETLQRSSQIDFIFKKSELLVKEERFDPWLARVLITELLWGKKKLSGDSKPIKTILAYQQIFNAHSTDAFEGPVKPDKVYKPRYVRVNTLSIPVQEAVDGFRDEGWTFLRQNLETDYEAFLSSVRNLNEYEFMVDIHIKEMLLFPNNTQFYKHNAYLDGSIILQDKASCLPVYILNPPPNSKVLDMCAAPGMKTTQIAAMLQNQGTVYAVEVDLKRIQTLNKLVECAGATCVKTINKDVLMINGEDIAGVEYILVDPSCSGSGISDRIELENLEGKDTHRLEKLAGFQIKILKHALNGFPDAKRVVYSTCSIYPEENEAVIKEVISSSTKFKLVDAAKLLDAPWLNFGSTDFGEIGSRCIYAKQEVDLTNGFFVAVFERLQDGEENIFLEKQKERVDGKKKRRNYSESHFEGEEDNGYSNPVEGINEETSTKRKNKNKKNIENNASHENFSKNQVNSNNGIVEDEDFNSNEKTICKKKHKNDIVEEISSNKKKKIKDQNSSNVDYIVEESISSKRKKHKNKSTEENSKNVDDIVEEESISIKKKSHKNKLTDDNYENVDDIVEEESISSKKKKHKNKLTDENSKNVDDIVEEESISSKKKKHKNKLTHENSKNVDDIIKEKSFSCKNKKPKNKINDENSSNVDDIVEEETISSKKTKHKNKLTDENSKNVDVLVEENSISSKKKKHKNKINDENNSSIADDIVEEDSMSSKTKHKNKLTDENSPVTDYSEQDVAKITKHKKKKTITEETAEEEVVKKKKKHMEEIICENVIVKTKKSKKHNKNELDENTEVIVKKRKGGPIQGDVDGSEIIKQKKKKHLDN